MPLSTNKFFKGVLSFLGLFAVILLVHYTDIFALRYYPVIMNFSIFLIFFTSLFQDETVIQKFARHCEKNYTDKIKKYTYNLTVVWAVYTFFNTLVSLFTVFMSEKVWIIYNGFVSYLLTAVVFIVEYIIRIKFKRDAGV